MSIQFKSAVLFVKDIATSRQFYEGRLGQQVEMDFGVNVGYIGGLALWEIGHVSQVVFGRESTEEARLGRDNLEVYFETDDLDATAKQLAAGKVPEVHPVREQPWGQRVLRVYDPDGHVVEIAEPMVVTVQRLAAEGLTPGQISAKTGMPPEAVAHLLAQ